MKYIYRLNLFLLILITACNPEVQPTLKAETLQVKTPTIFSQPTQLPTEPALVTVVPAVVTDETEPTFTATMETNQSTPVPQRDPEDWKSWPVVPSVTETAKEIYQNGLAIGKNPQAFIKIGDCETYSPWFLADFETDNYTLGDKYQSLSEVIDYFQGSYGRLSLAAKAGFNAASVLSPFWADREACEAEENPLSCEIRIMQPSFALVTLGSNDVWQPDKFETNYRAILDALIAEGVVPILATKADNIEGDQTINLKIAELAVEYDLPVWNFWASVQDLPDQGLQEDGVHLTWAPNRFDDEQIMQNAWPVRNLTALLVLDSIWHGVTE